MEKKKKKVKLVFTLMQMQDTLWFVFVGKTPTNLDY